MKTQLLQRSAAAALLTCSATAIAQPVPVEAPDTPPVSVYLGTPPGESLNKVSVSYRMGLNIKADFKNLGGFARIGNPGPASGSQVDRTYEQSGYNRVKKDGNVGDLTWYYGYANPDVVQGDFLVLQSSTSPADRKIEGAGDDDIHHGFEVAYSREFLRGKYGELAGEIAFGYTPVDISDHSTISGKVNRIVDRFALNGVIPPVAPYAGTFEGPGALIGSSPERSDVVLPEGAVVSGSRSLESDLFMFRLGPVWEFPIKGRLDGSLSAGVALIYADTTFHYSERVTIPAVGTQTRSGADSESDLLVGGYVGGALSYEVRPNTDVFAGVQFQSAGTSVTKTGEGGLGGKKAVLDLGESIFVALGLSYSF